MPASHYVIIGTGVAAFSAAAAIRVLDTQGDLTLVGEEPEGLYSRPGLAYLLSDEIPESQVRNLPAGDLSGLHARCIQARATAIDPQAHTVTLHNQTVLPYTHLLLATGARAVPLNLPGAQLPGVFKLDTLEDARKLIKSARRGRTAVVVGGGITALELAEGLLARGMRVHYLMRSGRYWSGVLDPAESDIVEARLRQHGLQLHPFTQIVEIQGKDRVTAVRTAAGEVIRCDLLAAAIGIRPRTELAVAAGLRVERGILVDEWLQTSAAHIYAAGDVAQVFDSALGQAILDSLWGAARHQGASAGYNMAAHALGAAGPGARPYHKPVPFNVTRLAGLPVTIIGTVGGGGDADLPGIARGDSETWRFAGESASATFSGASSQYPANRLRVMVGPGTLLGAVVLGDQAPVPVLRDLIGRQVDITPIREQLLAPGAPISALLAAFAERLGEGGQP